jgi:hypothetical protein
MNREELFQLHDELSSIAKEIMKNKNADYSKESPFGNFMLSEALQTCSAENGIINRMGDKLSRLVSVFAKGAQVDESVKDTILDIINYAVLLYGVHLFKMGNDPEMLKKSDGKVQP